MDLETSPSVPSQVISRTVEDETVLLDLHSGTYYGLDGVGQRIWEMIVRGMSLGDIVDVITTEYEVEEARAQYDVIEFVRDLVERGLLAK